MKKKQLIEGDYLIPNIYIILLYTNILYFFALAFYAYLKTDNKLSDNFNINPEHVFRTFGILIILTVIFGLLSITQSLLKARKLDEKYLLKCNLLLTFGLIPFYFLYFFCTGGLGLGFIFVTGPFSFLFCFVVMKLILIVGSVDGILFSISFLKRSNTNFFIILIHCFLQLCFFVNIMDSLYLQYRWKKAGN